MPVPVILPVALLGLLVAGVALSAKKKSPESSDEQPPSDTDAMARETVKRVMDPAFTDEGQIEYAAIWLQSNGYPEDAARVFGKLSSMRAARAAQEAGAAARAAAERAAEDAARKAREEWEKTTGNRPPRPTELDKLHATAMTLNDPGQVEYAWSILQAYGDPRADDLKSRAEALRKSGAARASGEIAKDVLPKQEPTLYTPPEAPPTDTAPPAAPPLPPLTSKTPGIAEQPEPDEEPDEFEPEEIEAEETQPDVDTYGTIALARKLRDAEDAPGWKRWDADVARWQAKLGMTSDGKFGVKSALRMGEEVGALPHVRYWPKTAVSKDAAVSDYRARLLALASQLQKESPAHALALRMSAVNETGQAYGKTQTRAVPESQQTDGSAIAAEVAKGLGEATARVAEAVKNTMGPWVLSAAQDADMTAAQAVQSAAQEAVGKVSDVIANLPFPSWTGNNDQGVA